MSVLVTSGSAYVRRLRQVVFNPSQKFITAQHELDALNTEALLYAARMGGIQFTDSTLTTVASQADYTTPDTWLEVPFLEIVTNPGLSTETAEKVFVTSYQRMQDYAQGTQVPPSSSRFAVFNPQTHNLHFEPAPPTAGLTIRAQVYGMPNEFLNSNALVDGPAEQINAIVYWAAASIRDFTRDEDEAERLRGRAREAEEAAAMARSQRNKAYQMNFADINNPEHFQRYGG